MQTRARTAPVLACAMLLALPACSAERSGEADLRGDRIEVLATWADAEQERFEKVLRTFEAQTGAAVTYRSAQHGMSQVLGRRIASGDPPDVAFLPQPGLLRELVSEGRLVPLDAATRDVVEAHFPPTFRELASVDGRPYGVWFKAANKSLIWYDIAAFERLGAVPPSDLDELLALARRFTGSGLPAFAVSGGSGWTLTDWFENLYLRLAGPQRYDDLAAHRIPWTHPSVVQTLALLDDLLAPDAVAGGVAGATRIDFSEAVEAVFADRPRAAMVMEGDFVAGVITSATDARLGVDADVFPFPAGVDGAPAVVGGGDVAVQLSHAAAGAALLRFLATPEAAEIWAAEGGFVSPNVDVELAVYPDTVTRSVARRLLEAGEFFRFDLSDLLPAALGGREDGGLRAELRDFLVHRDAARAAARIEGVADTAYRRSP